MAQDVPVTKVGTTPSPVIDVTKKHREVEVYKSGGVLYTDTTAVSLFEVPGYAVVKNVWVNVTTAFDASGASVAATATISTQNDTGTAVMWDSNYVGLQVTGMVVATGGQGTVMPASGGFVTMAYTPSTTTTGALEVYVEVLQIKDLVVT